jgi:asparagine synthase (glutamine-hydrolysing)
MVGLCGIVGDREHSIDALTDALVTTSDEVTTSYSDARLAIHSRHHSTPVRDPLATTEGETLVWVVGNIWGYEDSTGYHARQSGGPETVEQFCARRYHEEGIEFVDGLNGAFVAVLYDQAAGVVYVVTDRLATRPVFYARPSSGEFVFSTHVQSLPTYPSVEEGFDVGYLSEYFSLGSVGGIKTPFTGVEELPPSSVTSLDLDTGDVETVRYWRPRIEPIDEPFSYLLDQFVDRFETILSERVDPDLRYGLLLSGGSDSRAILAGLDDDIDLCTYHSTGWQSRETRTAERVADTAGRELRLLMHDRDSHARMLETVPETMNFIGRFCEAHVTTFGEQLRDEVDVLISGHGADTLFRDHAYPVPRIELGPLGGIQLPAVKEVTSVEEFVSNRAKELPAYLEHTESLTEVLERNITAGDGISHHGVAYDSVNELVFFDDFYPFSNKSDHFYHALNGVMPHWSPFFDNRLVDLALKMSLKHRGRRNIINATTAELDESLAEIPHSYTGVPLTQSFPVTFLWSHATHFRRRFFPSEEPPEPYLSHGPWLDANGLIRSHSFVEETLREKGPILDALPFLSREGAERCYQEQLNGGDNHFELYTLLSFLEMPVVEQLAAVDGPTAAPN